MNSRRKALRLGVATEDIPQLATADDQQVDSRERRLRRERVEQIAMSLLLRETCDDACDPCVGRNTKRLPHLRSAHRRHRLFEVDGVVNHVDLRRLRMYLRDI